MTRSVTYLNGLIFDGHALLRDHALGFENGTLAYMGPEDEAPASDQIIDLAGDILCPGFVDLQVNGGGGILFNDDPSVHTLSQMASAHRGLGVTAFLPTLITDTVDKSQAAIAAVEDAMRAGVPGIVGLHLEGPHLSIPRKGAHDPALIRPMEPADLETLLQAAGSLPFLKVTIAPENTTEGQVAALTEAGVLVSLGHSDADYDTCRRYIAAGARCVTHLFNAMSQLGNREPGLVGAALASGDTSAGLIADTVHVHPETIRAAWTAKRGPGRIFLVSDAMAVAGSDATEFHLGGRLIKRKDGVLTLADGTLAGADLDLLTAMRVMVEEVGVELLEALQACTAVPAGLIGHDYRFARNCDLVRISPDLTRLVAAEIKV
ncbi:MAG: N-acetylglucosamine-6-phosphate deacetylase [Rhodobacteraceae bacterium]|nr:N-acetylglucosamine-6-phosphate deacetylase [Paracoccaceae bacterium]